MTRSASLKTGGVFPDRVKPLVAIDAFIRLLKNKDDTAQVFRIIDAVAGKTRRIAFDRLVSTDHGRRLLRDRLDLSKQLSNRIELRALPAGTLGRAYVDFMDEEALTAEAFATASADSGALARLAQLGKDRQWFGLRVRDQHDLWHIITGYGREGLGELALLAFSYGQVGNRGQILIASLISIKLKRLVPDLPVRACLQEARDRANACAWLPGQRWEDLLETPLEALRSRLQVPPAPIYDMIRERAIVGDELYAK